MSRSVRFNNLRGDGNHPLNRPLAFCWELRVEFRAKFCSVFEFTLGQWLIASATIFLPEAWVAVARSAGIAASSRRFPDPPPLLDGHRADPNVQTRV
ncbi:hypothetical protein, partial [Ferroacidibacillus organovorans]|uniref:hypothetical protein n=1 Tax=Ferroacidibacillus organovorans TaxID=1765683 RepID=UPI0012E9175A